MRDVTDLKDLFLKLISATRGDGPSTTRLVYLLSGLAAVFCALVMTIGGILVYCIQGKADAVYWTAVAALWTAKLGFGTQAKNEQQKATADIVLNRNHSTMTAASASGD